MEDPAITPVASAKSRNPSKKSKAWRRQQYEKEDDGNFKPLIDLLVETRTKKDSLSIDQIEEAVSNVKLSLGTIPDGQDIQKRSLYEALYESEGMAHFHLFFKESDKVNNIELLGFLLDLLLDLEGSQLEVKIKVPGQIDYIRPIIADPSIQRTFTANIRAICLIDEQKILYICVDEDFKADTIHRKELGVIINAVAASTELKKDMFSVISLGNFEIRRFDVKVNQDESQMDITYCNPITVDSTDQCKGQLVRLITCPLRKREYGDGGMDILD